MRREVSEKRREAYFRMWIEALKHKPTIKRKDFCRRMETITGINVNTGMCWTDTSHPASGLRVTQLLTQQEAKLLNRHGYKRDYFLEKYAESE